MPTAQRDVVAVGVDIVNSVLVAVAYSSVSILVSFNVIVVVVIVIIGDVVYRRLASPFPPSPRGD